MVSVHKEMLYEAQAMLSKLKKEMEERYGEKVAEEVLEQHDEGEESTISRGTSQYTASTLTLDTNDRYLNGPARFIIEGMETLSTTATTSLAAQRAKEVDNYTIEVDTTGTNNSMESIATMKERQTNIQGANQIPTGTKEKSGNAIDKHKQIPHEREQERWERIGDEHAEQQLQQQIINNHDPGGTPRGTGF